MDISPSNIESSESSSPWDSSSSDSNEIKRDDSSESSSWISNSLDSKEIKRDDVIMMGKKCTPWHIDGLLHRYEPLKRMPKLGFESAKYIGKVLECGHIKIPKLDIDSRIILKCHRDMYDGHKKNR